MRRVLSCLLCACVLVACGPARVIDPAPRAQPQSGPGGSSSSTTGSIATSSSSGSTGRSNGSTSGSTGTTGGTTGGSTGSSTGSSSSTTTGSSTGTTGGTSTTGTPSTAPVIAGCSILPDSDMWNTDISAAAVSSHSSDWVGAIGASSGLHADFGTTWNGAPNGIPFIIVPADQPLVPTTFEYAGESDPGPYPIPLDAPIEGGPTSTGDRHVIALQQGTCMLYEMYNSHPGASDWQSGSGAVWDLSTSQQRPDRWTSADAAGLAILPGLVKYDEVAAGEIRHALRFTATQIQSAYIYPATHSDGRAGSDATHPPMGARFRLKSTFDVSPFPADVQVILVAMKRYGLVLADTGGDWFVSGAPDSRWDDGHLAMLSQIPGSAFEAIENGAVHPY